MFKVRSVIMHKYYVCIIQFQNLILLPFPYSLIFMNCKQVNFLALSLPVLSYSIRMFAEKGLHCKRGAEVNLDLSSYFR